MVSMGPNPELSIPRLYPFPLTVTTLLNAYYVPGVHSNFQPQFIVYLLHIVPSLQARKLGHRDVTM